MQRLIECVPNFSEGNDLGIIKQITDQVETPRECFVVRVLPTIIFFSSLMAVLYHLGLMQIVVKGIDKQTAMERSLLKDKSDTAIHADLRWVCLSIVARQQYLLTVCTIEIHHE